MNWANGGTPARPLFPLHASRTTRRSSSTAVSWTIGLRPARPVHILRAIEVFDVHDVSPDRKQGWDLIQFCLQVDGDDVRGRTHLGRELKTVTDSIGRDHFRHHG